MPTIDELYFLGKGAIEIKAEATRVVYCAADRCRHREHRKCTLPKIEITSKGECACCIEKCLSQS